ncbi:MAG: protoporphyrinogen oxidase HemJ [Maricaulaceae bacterium]
MTWLSNFIASHYDWFRGLHILSVIAWMAGLLYLPRLFVYHCGATPDGELHQTLVLQERRLLKQIMTPAMLATWVFAIIMIVGRIGLITTPWFYAKLVVVVALSAFHMYLAAARKQFETGGNTRSHRYWRLMNEAPFVAAIASVGLAVLEP